MNAHTTSLLIKGKEGKNMKGERENKERRKQPK
jgi:hypothetical protein